MLKCIEMNRFKAIIDSVDWFICSFVLLHIIIKWIILIGWEKISSFLDCMYLYVAFSSKLLLRPLHTYCNFILKRRQCGIETVELFAPLPPLNSVTFFFSESLHELSSSHFKQSTSNQWLSSWSLSSAILTSKLFGYSTTANYRSRADKYGVGTKFQVNVRASKGEGRRVVVIGWLLLIISKKITFDGVVWHVQCN